MSTDAEHQGGLVEPEGVNAGGPIDKGPAPEEPAEPDPAGGRAGERKTPAHDPVAKDGGELLSRPGSGNGLNSSGPGQEMSVAEG